jgi:hypothetical protein
MTVLEWQERNERLFYKVLIENVEELLPIVYTPIEGDACEEYGEIFHRSGGLFISINDKYVAFIAHPTHPAIHTHMIYKWNSFFYHQALTKQNPWQGTYLRLSEELA